MRGSSFFVKTRIWQILQKYNWNSFITALFWSVGENGTRFRGNLKHPRNVQDHCILWNSRDFSRFYGISRSLRLLRNWGFLHPPPNPYNFIPNNPPAVIGVGGSGLRRHPAFASHRLPLLLVASCSPSPWSPGPLLQACKPRRPSSFHAFEPLGSSLLALKPSSFQAFRSSKP